MLFIDLLGAVPDIRDPTRDSGLRSERVFLYDFHIGACSA